MAIELPGYTTLLTDKVFGKRTEPYTGPGKHVELTHLVKLFRFKVATEAEIIGSIQDAIRTYKSKDANSCFFAFF